MVRTVVVSLTEADKVRIEELSAAGWTSRLIGLELGRNYRTVSRHLERLRRRPLPTQRRSPTQLTLAEREEISRGLVAADSLRAIAARLGRAPSTISREVNANGGRRDYRAHRADSQAWQRALRPKETKLAGSELLRWLVEAGLERRWSPEQIAGWLRRSFPDRPELWVSHETIYQSLYVQARGALRKELTAYLRRRHTSRRPRGYSTYNGQGRLRGVLNISERPAEAQDRAVPGHWESQWCCQAA
jgi:IS30 family transposase